MKAKITVTMKPGILDPQGRAIKQSLEMLGFPAVEEVKVGKYIEIELKETERAVAETQVQAMCHKLLANTVIENYHYELDAGSERETS